MAIFFIKTKQAVIDGIYKDYRQYGITKERIKNAIELAEQDGVFKTYGGVNAGIRLSLSKTFGVPEQFSLEDAAAFCEISIDEVKEGIKGGKSIVEFMREYDATHPTVPQDIMELREITQ